MRLPSIWHAWDAIQGLGGVAAFISGAVIGRASRVTGGALMGGGNVCVAQALANCVISSSDRFRENPLLHTRLRIKQICWLVLGATVTARTFAYGFSTLDSSEAVTALGGITTGFGLLGGHVIANIQLIDAALAGWFRREAEGRLQVLDGDP